MDDGLPGRRILVIQRFFFLGFSQTRRAPSPNHLLSRDDFALPQAASRRFSSSTTAFFRGGTESAGCVFFRSLRADCYVPFRQIFGLVGFFVRRQPLSTISRDWKYLWVTSRLSIDVVVARFHSIPAIFFLVFSTPGLCFSCYHRENTRRQ